MGYEHTNGYLINRQPVSLIAQVKTQDSSSFQQESPVDSFFALIMLTAFLIIFLPFVEFYFIFLLMGIAADSAGWADL